MFFMVNAHIILGIVKFECLGIMCGCDTECFQNVLDNLWLMCSLDSHLSTYSNLCLAMFVSRFLCSLLMKVCRFWIAPLDIVPGG